ncbi:SGNH/GDSL hydrolase family protein [Pseudobacteriovorax antillogorgiicola]|uniref:GDSL-like Lipase/Acylhydrolase n=1 Tax=Pseudobacteriovorax antillogorgiicola TaxID=1513793 RepID=A0A1Y6C7K8_9BACT|nr:SGNH/GDSL hydrolase family protein [Pseudobacteriovorax antillogorgiicola]TCS49323.1 GDSL-like lipase/acylhydrolase family protein [Pseudobacteriovorax antillogorgiicola]SMF48068.1 GDSL-like Lipase/Acylhydrolase [Pseudobacteriovorax antillogorgiicola]
MAKFLALFILIQSQISFAGRIAFLGDSISTGGAAHPYLALEPERFRKVFLGEVPIEPDRSYRKMISDLGYSYSDTQAPIRLRRSYREFQHPAFWFFDNLWTSFGAEFLDAEEYAWSYLLGRRLGYQSNEILIAARDGEKMSHGVRQVDRILDYTEGVLPEKLFIFFTGNDLCGPTIEHVTSSDDFESELRDLLRYLKVNGIPAPGGTTVYVMNPVGIIQIATSSKILSHRVPYQGKELSCKEIQTLDPAKVAQENSSSQLAQADFLDLVINSIANSPAGYCMTLFAIHKGDTQMQIALSNRIQDYRKSITKLVKEFSDMAGTDILFKQLTSTNDILFEGDEMANDCFHLALKGHHRIADSIFNELKK